MSLQTRITALVQAIGADIKALYSGKVGTSDARLTDAREWTASTVTQAEAEQGTATTRRAWTAQRVFQAVAAWWSASAMKTKLDGIAAGATANATDAQLRDRSTHTGTQAISTVSGLQTALDGKINTTERGVSGGVATLDQFARIPASQLPSYVDDVLEYPTRQDFPATGEGGKIYIAINQGTAANPTVWWRWTGTTYVDIPPSPGTTDALTEGSTNLYFNESRVRNTVLTGLSLANSATVAATDTVLAAFGKIQAQLGLKAPLASPALTGNPTAPTPATEDDDTSIATTAFVRAAMGLFGLSNPSTQQAWHAGNLVKQTSVDDLNTGRVVLAETVRRRLPGEAYNTYCDRLILLHPLLVSTLLPYSIVDGKITATRGSVGQALNQASVEVVSSSAYNGHATTFNSVDFGWQAVSCMYQGVKYAALIVPYNASAYGGGIFFEGRAVSTDTNQLLCVEYYNRQTATVLNAEVYNSIAPLATRDDFRVCGKKVWREDTFDPATKQDKSAVVTTATSRTLALTDAWNYVRPGTTGAVTLTVPTNASVAFDVGTEITVRALGNITLAAASGVTLNAPSGGTLSMTARMTVTIKKVATNEWDVIGQTVAA